MQLGGNGIAVRLGVCVLIPPGVRHRAVGPMKVRFLVLPQSDAADDWFD
jgi:hypothetical protein